MKTGKLHLISTAAAVLFGGSAALAQPSLSVYGPMRRNVRPAHSETAEPLYAAVTSPAAAVFGAVAIPNVRRVAARAPESRASGAPVAIAVAEETDANRAGQEGPAATAGRARASAALELTETVRTISSAALPARDALLSEVNARLATSESAMAVLRARARIRGEGSFQTALRDAVKDAQARAKALQRSIKAADRTKASGWAEARADLAAHYRAYAEAVAHAEAVASWSEADDPARGSPDLVIPLEGTGGDARSQMVSGVER